MNANSSASITDFSQSRGIVEANNPAACASKTEEKLALIWCEVLGLPKVGIRDNFFELGGHSLRLTQVISRIRNVFQIELPFAQVFQTPTIAQLSLLLEERTANGVEDPITQDSKSRIIKRRRIYSGQPTG